MKIDVAFPSYEGSLTLRGSAYLPDEAAAPVPVIIMTHGMADSAARLVPAAEWFAANGFGVLLYDHRNFGPSDGEPRQEFDPIAQCRDMQMAITFAETFDGFDADRISLWGTSFSGGHVLAVTGMDKRVKAVVSQAPWIAGVEIVSHILGAAAFADFQDGFNVERRRLLKGEKPSQTRVVRHPERHDQGFAIVDGHEGYDYMVNGPAGIPIGWMNSFTTRSLEHAFEFDVRSYATRIAPAPLMMILGEHDALIPADLAHRFFEAVTGPKELVTIDAEHHSLYMPGKGFEDTMEAATRWFTAHLAL